MQMPSLNDLFKQYSGEVAAKIKFYDKAHLDMETRKDKFINAFNYITETGKKLGLKTEIEQAALGLDFLYYACSINKLLTYNRSSFIMRTLDLEGRVSVMDLTDNVIKFKNKPDLVKQAEETMFSHHLVNAVYEMALIIVTLEDNVDESATEWLLNILGKMKLINYQDDFVI